MIRSGIGEIEFQFTPNPGVPVKSLRAIASSGEMACVMLVRIIALRDTRYQHG